MRVVCLFLLVICSLSFLSATHYITGVVEDALDGTSADGRTVVLWNPLNGTSVNLTDVIGPTGNSGASNVFLIDCELSPLACQLSDVLRVRILNTTDDYVSFEQSVTITGAGFDVVENLTLNSPPNTIPLSPVSGAAFSSALVNLTCQATDLDFNLQNISLFGNWSGGLHLNATMGASSGSANASWLVDLPEGNYTWSCQAEDNLSISRSSLTNSTFAIDRTAPTISSVFANESFFCGAAYLIEVNCTASDDFLGIDTAFLRVFSPTFEGNYSFSSQVGDTFFTDVLINETGEWTFGCVVNDSVNNFATLNTSFVARDNVPDLRVVSPSLEDLSPLEFQAVNFSATLFNDGCVDASSVLVGYFSGDPTSGGVSFANNVSYFVASETNVSISSLWSATVGPSTLFITADVNDSFAEYNESNNQVNTSLNVSAWQPFYGNLTGSKILSNQGVMNLSLWVNISEPTGNIFVTDSEAQVNWFSLQALGRGISGVASSSDFSELDLLLAMENFSDSIEQTFAPGDSPHSTESFLLFQYNVSNVAVSNISATTPFRTGLLWDTSDDTGDLEFSFGDREDVIFVGSVLSSQAGEYGTYDFELHIPSPLRSYNSSDVSEVYFYYDLL